MPPCYVVLCGLDLIKRNELRDGDLQPDDTAVLLENGFEVHLQKRVKLPRRIHRQILLRIEFHLPIILLLAGGMDMASPGESSDVSIKQRADVIQLVKNGDEFLVEGLVEKSWEIKGQDVGHLPPFDEEPLNGPRAAMTYTGERSVLKPHRCQFGLQSVQHFGSGLGKADGHPGHVNMSEGFVPIGDVVAEPGHRLCKIQRGPHSGHLSWPGHLRLHSHCGEYQRHPFSCAPATINPEESGATLR